MDERIATAEWADPALVEEKYLYQDGEVWLGRSPRDHLVPLGFCDDRHVCLVSGSRGGKGTSSIVNNLILWPGSIFVVDPKGENATITASRRGKGSSHCTGLGQAVQVLDPFKTAQVDDSLRGRFNPLDALAADKEESIDEASRVADAIVVVHESNDPFWDESARSMVKALLLHVLTAPEYEGRRNLITVRNLILRGDWEAVDALKAAGETDIPPAHGLLWTGLVNNPAFGGLVAGIGDSFTNMLLNSPKQYESVLQVANRNTEFIDSPGMQRCLEASDFQLSDLKTRPGGLSVYLCLPQMYMSTHYRWLRMMIGLTVTGMEKVSGRPATGHPVLMVLDEFAGLQRMEVIENAVAQIAGYGVKLFFVLQSLEQLKAVYKDNWETFLANSGLKVFFNLEDNFSRDYVSKLIGETEVMREVASESETKGESDSTSHSTTKSQSETHGTSSSAGTSVSDGTNSSVSSGTSFGTNRSKSHSKTFNYAEGIIFRKWDWSKVGDTRGTTQGTSKGWTKGLSKGLSHGTSSSRTDGTSESVTTGTSETEGTTHGTSQSSTSGTSETIQKRALITPDEIGQAFARIDDKTEQGYPGLALVIISGARPLALMRVNYYEDYQFMGLFDPAPDFPFNAPKDLCVDGRQMGLSLPEFGLKVGAWSITPGSVAASNDGAASIVSGEGKDAAYIRVPRAGLVTAVQAGGAVDVPAGPLFSLRYYEDGTALIDPFAELRALCKKLGEGLAARKRALAAKRLSALAGLYAFGLLAAIMLVLAIARQSRAPLAGVIVFGALAIWMAIRVSGVDSALQAFGPAEAAQAAPPPALAAAPASVVASSAEGTPREQVSDIPESQPQQAREAISATQRTPVQPLRITWKTLAVIGACAILVAGIFFLRGPSKTAAPDPQAQNPINSATAPGAAARPEPAPSSATRPPAAANAIMIGSVDVSQVAGIKMGDTPEQVGGRYPLYDPHHDAQTYGDGVYFYRDGDLSVVYANGGAHQLTLFNRNGMKNRWDNDSLVSLYGRSEAEAIRELGPPSGRAPSSPPEGDHALFWFFPNSDQKLRGTHWPTSKALGLTIDGATVNGVLIWW